MLREKKNEAYAHTHQERVMLLYADNIIYLFFTF